MRGSRISFRYRGKHRVLVRTAIVDAELAAAMKELLALPGGRRLFRYERRRRALQPHRRRLNDYIDEHLGEEFTAKDFRTWGGTLLAAIALAEHESAGEPRRRRRRIVAGVMRASASSSEIRLRLRASSYVSPAVVEQYLDGRTIEDFRPRHLRVVGARDIGLDREEQALLEPAPFVANSACARSRVNSESFALRFALSNPVRGGNQWHARRFSSATTAARKSTKAKARRCA